VLSAVTAPHPSAALRGCLGVALAGLLIALSVTAPSAEAQAPKKGTFRGVTKQTTVAKTARQLEFRVKGRRITLNKEPVLRRSLCLSPPVFTLEGTPRTRVRGGGSFSYVRTFVGSRFHRITGRFVDSKTIEGTALYFFQGTDLCSEGRVQVRFRASSRKKRRGQGQQQ
jgi:hypothetical protein